MKLKMLCNALSCSRAAVALFLLLLSASNVVRGAAVIEKAHGYVLPRGSLDTRQAAPAAANGPVVDLGYERYRGVNNASTGLTTFFGVRYAAPPTGDLRFQSPTAPATNRSQIIPATSHPNRCPQALSPNPYEGTLCPGLQNDTTLPKSCANDSYFVESIEGNEDCLFLDVYAPTGKTDLPVMVWIHGGGYNAGAAVNYDFTPMLAANGNSFIAVVIQYRLGAFGFLSSDEAFRRGTVNAGMQDQHFALEWTKKYISKFGGDPNRVTISGESAGGGAVMLQTLWAGGFEGTSLFSQAIAASPYLPMQYNYSDFAPTQFYYALADAVGCSNLHPNGSTYRPIFDCLVNVNSQVLQYANAIVAASGIFGTWGFLPVTDGQNITQLPSQQLLQKKVNGKRVLVGNMADEGPLFTPQNIITPSDFKSYIRRTFPLFTDTDINDTISTYSYSGDNQPTNPSAPRFGTTGVSGLTALNQSTFGTGQQQRVNNLYGETTFQCPGYWLAEAFTGKGTDYAGYKYQFSSIPAIHGYDLYTYFPPFQNSTSPAFRRIVQQIWGNFTVHSTPAPALSLTQGRANYVNTSRSSSPSAKYPQWPYMLNMNETGGEAGQLLYDVLALNISITQDVGPGLKPLFSVEDAISWEGGRGGRCEFWRGIGGRVPE